MVLAVTDSSVLIAIAQKEALKDIVYDYIHNIALLTVNGFEVIIKLMNYWGITVGEAQNALSGFNPQIIAYEAELINRAALIHQHSREIGLSLGDCGCLALAEELHLPVLTTDRDWKKIQDYITTEIILAR